MKKVFVLCILALLSLHAKDYRKHPQAKSMMNILIKKHHFKRAELEKLFAHVRIQHSALRAFTPRHKQKRRKETRTPKQIKKAKMLRSKYGPWERYSRYIVSDRRVAQGIAFVKRHRKTFARAEKKYGVPKEYIAAIIGIESAFGKNVGKYPVFDTLATLAFEKNRRNKFFKKQLIEFLKLSKQQRFNPKNVKGSYAGAIGLVQFMPSNYAHYGVDFNGDGRITLQRADDAIASVANYFKKNGWRRGEPVATRVTYKGTRFRKHKTGYRHTYHRRQLRGIAPRQKWDYKNKVRLIKLNKKNHDELWYGAKNFFVITRYNHSSYYAMAVHQLAQKIKAGLRQ
jgi:membrane-bound lytic murein transglycosylase B